jgi:tRNA dimethylallyltransferase
LTDRLEKEGLSTEVKKLHKQGVSWKRLESFGLEYRFVSRYLRGLLTYDEMFEQLNIAIQQFAKRQMTWFKRDKDIKWITTPSQAEKLAKNLYTPPRLTKRAKADKLF